MRKRFFILAELELKSGLLLAKQELLLEQPPSDLFVLAIFEVGSNFKARLAWAVILLFVLLVLLDDRCTPPYWTITWDGILCTFSLAALEDTRISTSLIVRIIGLNQHTQCKKYLFLIQGSKKIENEKKKVFRENSDQKGTGAVGVRTLAKVHSNKNLHTWKHTEY